MFYLLIIAGAAIGGVLGWLFDRRILKRDGEDEKKQDTTPTWGCGTSGAWSGPLYGGIIGIIAAGLLSAYV